MVDLKEEKKQEFMAAVNLIQETLVLNKMSMTQGISAMCTLLVNAYIKLGISQDTIDKVMDAMALCAHEYAEKCISTQTAIRMRPE